MGQCQCSLDMNSVITSGGFRCFTDSPEVVTYRAQLHGTSEVAALDLLDILEEWLTTRPSINVKAQFLNVHISCPVSIASLNEAECDVSSVAATGSPTTVIVSTPGGLDMTIIIIIIAVVCAIVIVTIVVLSLVLFFSLRARRTPRKRMTQNK